MYTQMVNETTFRFLPAVFSAQALPYLFTSPYRVACPLSRLKRYGQMRLHVLQLTQPLYQDEVYPDSGATAISDAIGNYRKQELLCSKYDWGKTA